MAALGYSVAMVLVMVFRLFIRAFVLYKVWNWFMPRLFDLPSLGLVSAFALGLVVGVFTYTGQITSYKDDKDGTIVAHVNYGELFVQSLTYHLIVLFTAWTMTFII